MDRYEKLGAAFAVALACGGCPSGEKEAPPREEPAELASAAPKALGALAGGTDAAPPVVLAPRPSEEVDGVPIPELEADGGADPDAAAEGEELPL
jgi:hypothetical protein